MKDIIRDLEHLNATIGLGAGFMLEELQYWEIGAFNSN
jgi:hypothetical protein